VNDTQGRDEVAQPLRGSPMRFAEPRSQLITRRILFASPTEVDVFLKHVRFHLERGVSADITDKLTFSSLFGLSHSRND
jgi:hypothetical protein